MVGIGLENRDTLKGVTPFDSTVLRHLWKTVRMARNEVRTLDQPQG